MNTELLLVASLLALAVPVIFALAAVVIAAGAGRVGVVATVAAGVAVAVAAGCAGACGFVSGVKSGVRVDAVTAVMVMVVTIVGLVVVRFSRTSLQRDPGFRRAMVALLALLAAVCTVVIVNNLWVMAAAWTVMSLPMHQLLMFYRHRPQAILVAHKKFITARLADVCIWSGVALISTTVGSADLDVIAVWLDTHPLTTSLEVAAVLVVFAAALRSAQLPFHGWLMQVMEAPTPVSALLHAGVVNIGGFLMIRMAPLMVQVPAAQLLLVIIGTVTAVVAVLVMTTRVSIKVMLAWSTCAQMGFMLVECGLGMWHLALLHLAAHSFYKAHAFLSAGNTVDVWKVRDLAAVRAPASLRRFAATLLVAVVVAGITVGTDPTPARVTLALLLAFSVVPLLASIKGDRISVMFTVVQGAGLMLLYVGGHALAERVVAVVPAPAPVVSWIVLAMGLVVLFVFQILLTRRPLGAFARAMQPRLFAGFHLDERFTRLTFRVWPPRLPAPTVAVTLTTLTGES